jgi:hypothetical protein
MYIVNKDIPKLLDLKSIEGVTMESELDYSIKQGLFPHKWELGFWCLQSSPSAARLVRIILETTELFKRVVMSKLFFEAGPRGSVRRGRAPVSF